MDVNPLVADANFDVSDSTFFKNHKHLPSPDEVRLLAKTQCDAGTHWGRKDRDVSAHYNARPSLAVFDSLGCFVKWGSEMRVEEGQCLLAIRRHFKGAVPVPEIYGWRTHNDEVFLYMEAINGTTLEQAWESMGEDDRVNVCGELRVIFDTLRQLTQPPEDTYIGSIRKGPLYDRAISIAYMQEPGPFASVKEFHDWFVSLHKRPMEDPSVVPPEPFRPDLPDDCSIAFTQGDLHPSNILLSLSSPHRVIAILDWEQAGWLPEYWEDRKAHYTCDYFGEWSTKYLPMIMDQYTSTWDPWDYYTTSMAC